MFLERITLGLLSKTQTFHHPICDGFHSHALEQILYHHVYGLVTSFSKLQPGTQVQFTVHLSLFTLIFLENVFVIILNINAVQKIYIADYSFANLSQTLAIYTLREERLFLRYLNMVKESLLSEFFLY